MSSFDSQIPDAESSVTVITFLPDGRVCLFGASTEVLELLGELNLGDELLNSRLDAIRSFRTTVARPAVDATSNQE